MSGKRRWRKSKKAKKEYERLERERAEHQAKARIESEHRRELIKARWDLDDQQLRAAKNPKQRELKEQELKAKKLKELLDSARDSTRDDDLVDRVSELIELVGLQDREIQYLAQFRKNWERIQAYNPDALESLSTQSLFAQLRPLADKLMAEEKPKERWDWKRGNYKWYGDIGLIEYEFGGTGEAERQKQPWAGLSGSPYQPTCLDDIFAGGAVHMHDSEGEVLLWPQQRHRILLPGLQRLFGMHRNRLGEYLRRFKNPSHRRERSYDYRDVTKIMAALLSEKTPERKARGAPRRLWLNDPNDPDLRTRVLSGIVAQLNNLSVYEHIKTAFLTVIHRHLPDSAKK